MGHSCTTLRVSYGFRDIHTFSFSIKIQDGGQKWQQIEIFPLCIGHFGTTLGEKLASNRSISYGFRDIQTFSFSAKMQDGRQKWQKLKFFPFA